MSKRKSAQVGQQGSPSWAFNRLREDALVQLMNDLSNAQQAGLNKPACDLVKDALAKAVNCATAIPDGSFLTRPVWKDMRRFEITYHSWNEDKTPEPEAIKHRRKELERLRDLRNKIARRTRKNFAVIDKELDIKFVEDVYSAFGNLVTFAPEIFKSLAGALARFSKAV